MPFDAPLTNEEVYFCARRTLEELVHNQNFTPERLRREGAAYKPSEMSLQDWNELVEDYINNLSSTNM